jgi:hypothetical protein
LSDRPAEIKPTGRAELTAGHHHALIVLLSPAT